MKTKYSVCAVVLMLGAVMTSPAYALFTNGGFETGDLTGWTFQYGDVHNNTAAPVWGYTPNGTIAPQVISASSALEPGQTLDVNPYNDNFMLKINNIVGLWHATRVFQTDTLAAEDIGDTVYVNWGAMLVDPRHPLVDQPFFRIDIKKNDVTVDSFSANATDAAAAGSGWTNAGSSGGTLWYKAGQYQYNLTGSWSIGDSITVDMMVADCGQGGHGGFAFLDGIGTDYVKPPNGVPEPSSLMLLMTGLLGAGIMRKKFAK